MPGWSERVSIVAGHGGYAYVPGQILIRRGTTYEERRLAVELLGYEANADGDDICGEGWERSGDDYWKVPNYSGDVPSAIRRLRGAGLTAQPNHVFFADSDMVHGNPVHGNPVYGNPVYGNPVYGNPVYGNPVYGNPVYGNPVYGNPVYGNPVYGNPVYGNPVYGNASSQVCGGGSCWCEADPCTRAQHTEAASLVYPNPVFARSYYSDKAALSYELTGMRPSNAIPLFPQPVVALPENSAWTDDAVRVAVIDTGWPRPPAELTEMYKPEIVEANAHGESAGTGDLPDSEIDGYLDPVAGHGMFIAGLILRYAPGTSVQVVEALSTYGDGDEDQIATAIEGLFPDGNGPTPDIVSLSFGTYTPELPERLALAVQKAIAGGAVVVASAGNDGTSQKQYPAAYDGVVSVAALGPNGPAPFSNWGDWVRACAPGVDVPSGFWTFDGTSAAEAGADRDRYQGWALWSGTSFAAPIVAAAIAQTMQRGFDANPAMELVVEYPGLHRLPCYGTVVNPPPAIPTL